MPNPGDLLVGRYRILERLGSGGTATVHRAHDERLDRDVAVKVLLPNLAGDPPTAARFEREARSLAAASHQGVVAVFDVDGGDPDSGREPFLVMELCSGGSLADRLAGGRRMAPDDLIPILVPVADGLADLHRRGVVHRDIKPQNILFVADRAKLADFGLALADGGTGLSELTQPGTAVGTLAYLAPEILGGERATSAADVYALGVVAFVALAGEPPRPASSMAEVVTASRSPARRISDVAPDLGPSFDDVVASALAVRPVDRPDALGLASGLTTALGRWSRDGGSGRFSAVMRSGGVPVPGPADQVAVARSPAGDRAAFDDATTAMAIPVTATAQIPAEDSPPAVRPMPTATGTERARPPSWLVVAASIATVILLTIAVLAALARPARPSGAGGPSATIAPPASSSAPRSASPSIGATPSAAPPSPSQDPAVAAANAMDAAISAARGGPDGLKGKEANDLQEQLADVRRALDAGDRRAALDAARKLDHRVADLAKDLGRDQAAALRAASANLVRVLGG